jgi:hypothetical protein
MVSSALVTDCFAVLPKECLNRRLQINELIHIVLFPLYAHMQPASFAWLGSLIQKRVSKVRRLEMLNNRADSGKLKKPLGYSG